MQGNPVHIKGAGFVLVATMWVVAGLTLLAGFIAHLVDVNVQQAIESKEQLQFDLDYISTRETLFYLLASNSMNAKGLAVMEEQAIADDVDSDEYFRMAQDVGGITFDGRLYQGIARTRFSVQDEAGLLSINSPELSLFDIVLNHLGLDFVAKQEFLARLKDYIDADSELRIGGAEYYEYKLAQKPLPPNGLMLSIQEVENLLDFDRLLTAEQWALLAPLLTVRQATGYNFNLMPEKVLEVVLGSKDKAERVIEYRRTTADISNLRQIEAIVGEYLDIPEEDVRVLPSANLKIEIHDSKYGWYRVMGIQLLPFGEDAPWRVDYLYTYTENAQINEDADLSSVVGFQFFDKALQ